MSYPGYNDHMRWLIGILLAIAGAFLAAQIGLVVAGDFIFRAADGTHLPGCGNVGIEPGLFIGFALGAAAGVWVGRLPSSEKSS